MLLILEADVEVFSGDSVDCYNFVALCVKAVPAATEMERPMCINIEHFDVFAIGRVTGPNRVASWSLFIVIIDARFLLDSSLGVEFYG